MSRFVLFLAALAGLSVSSAALAGGDPRRGGQVYRACTACHALEPGLHLSGPSLDGFMGRIAGTGEGFERYSTETLVFPGTRPHSTVGCQTRQG